MNLCNGRVLVGTDSFLHSVASPFHSFVTTSTLSGTVIRIYRPLWTAVHSIVLHEKETVIGSQHRGMHHRRVCRRRFHIGCSKVAQASLHVLRTGIREFPVRCLTDGQIAIRMAGIAQPGPCLQHDAHWCNLSVVIVGKHHDI